MLVSWTVATYRYLVIREEQRYAIYAVAVGTVMFVRLKLVMGLWRSANLWTSFPDMALLLKTNMERSFPDYGFQSRIRIRN